MSYTASLGGVDIGEGTDYRFKTMPTGITPGDYRTTRQNNGSSDGVTTTGPDLLGSRLIVFEIQVLDTAASIETLLQTVVAAWGPIRTGVTTLELTLAGSDYVLYGRPISVESVLTSMRYGKGVARLSFEATDPRLFAATESVANVGLTNPGGFTFPLTFPLSFGVSGTSSVQVVNAGTYATDWTASIVGPVTDPKLLHAETGLSIELAGVVPAGSVLTVSSSDKSILLNGSPRQSWLTLSSRWWELASGSNTVRFLASDGTGSATISWRSAYL